MQIHAHVRSAIGLGLVVIFFVVFQSGPDKVVEDFFGLGRSSFIELTHVGNGVIDV